MPEHKKGQVWSKPKNKLMLQFESETSKNAIYNGKITGQFEYWLWQLEKTEKSKVKPKTKPLTQTEIKEDIRMLEVMQIAAVPKEQEKLQRQIERRKQMLKPQHIDAWERKPDKSKSKWKIDEKKISDLKFSIIMLKEQKKNKEKYYSDKIKATNDSHRKQELRKVQAKIRRTYSNDIDKVNNSIIRHKLHYSKIRALVKKTFPDQKSESHSTAIRGYRHSSYGYDIEIPTVYNPIIRISWNPGMYMSGEKEEAINKRFKDKLKPVLKENGIEFTETSSEIIIQIKK